MNQPLTPIKSAILQDMLERLDLVDAAGSVNIGKSNVEANFYAETPSLFPGDYKAFRNLFIGMGTHIEVACVLAPDVLIGRFCSIANFIHMGAGRHPMEYLSTGDFPKRPDDRARDDREKYNDDSLEISKRHYTVIGNDVWIGVNACLIGGKNLSIGHGACIGAGAVVTKDVPPYAVVGGNPARVIRHRFEPPVVDELLRLRWWTLPVEVLSDLPYRDVAACVERLKEIRGR